MKLNSNELMLLIARLAHRAATDEMADIQQRATLREALSAPAKMEKREMTSQEYNAICRRQRQAYFAWQASAEGNSGEAFKEYLAASKALEDAQRAAA